LRFASGWRFAGAMDGAQAERVQAHRRIDRIVLGGSPKLKPGGFSRAPSTRCALQSWREPNP
jgi:hypothetical protein